MADLFGAQSIPISTSPGTPVVVTVSPADPLLSYLGSYFKTCANALLGAEWRALAPLTTNPVAHAFEHDPTVFEFVDTKLPGLFLFRNAEAGTVEDLAADWKISTETVSVLWVLPSTSQDKTAARARFPSKLFHLFAALIDAGRDPAWRVSGDAESRAATAGSSLATYGKYHRLRVLRSARRAPLAIPIENAKPVIYPAYEAILEVRERLVRDAARYAELDGADVSIRTTDQDHDDGGKVLETFSLET